MSNMAGASANRPLDSHKLKGDKKKFVELIQNQAEKTECKNLGLISEKDLQNILNGKGGPKIGSKDGGNEKGENKSLQKKLKEYGVNKSPLKNSEMDEINSKFAESLKHQSKNIKDISWSEKDEKKFNESLQIITGQGKQSFKNQTDKGIHGSKQYQDSQKKQPPVYDYKKSHAHSTDNIQGKHDEIVTKNEQKNTKLSQAENNKIHEITEKISPPVSPPENPTLIEGLPDAVERVKDIYKNPPKGIAKEVGKMINEVYGSFKYLYENNMKQAFIDGLNWGIKYSSFHIVNTSPKLSKFVSGEKFTKDEFYKQSLDWMQKNRTTNDQAIGKLQIGNKFEEKFKNGTDIITETLNSVIDKYDTPKERKHHADLLLKSLQDEIQNKLNSK